MLSFAIAMLMTATTTAADTTAAGAERAPTVEATETATARQDAEKVDAKPKKICRKVQSTGSRLTSGKLCKTEEEWKRFFAE
jgi:hypothetical protein